MSLPASVQPSQGWLLDDWLEWLHGLQPDKIELGLERVQQVLLRLELNLDGIGIVTVAGTNGKGSTIANLESLYQHAGFNTLTFTSPHLLRYNERIRCNSSSVSDNDLISAFAAVKHAQNDTPLTYFEWATLAALWLIADQRPDVALLEVGLGGRLDAVNAVDADVAVITSIDLDHMEWLGNTREQIGSEKAGIARQGKPLICTDKQPPDSVTTYVKDTGAIFYCYGKSNNINIIENNSDMSLHVDCTWKEQFQIAVTERYAAYQLRNLAAVIAVATIPATPLPEVPLDIIRSGRWITRPAGRLQQLTQAPDVWVDVAHNPAAASALSEWLQQQPLSRTIIMLGMLSDKDAQSVAGILAPYCDQWFTLATDGERGQSAEVLANRISPVVQSEVIALQSIENGLKILSAQTPDSSSYRVVICGSFDSAAKALQWSGIDK